MSQIVTFHMYKQICDAPQYLLLVLTMMNSVQVNEDRRSISPRVSL